MDINIHVYQNQLYYIMVCVFACILSNEMTDGCREIMCFYLWAIKCQMFEWLIKKTIQLKGKWGSLSDTVQQLLSLHALAFQYCKKKSTTAGIILTSIHCSLMQRPGRGMVMHDGVFPQWLYALPGCHIHILSWLWRRAVMHVWSQAETVPQKSHNVGRQKLCIF